MNTDTGSLKHPSEHSSPEAEQGSQPDSWTPRHNPWLIALAVMSATFMEVLDTTIVNVALRHIAGSLAAGNDEATWVVTSYLVSNAIILPASGWLAIYFGRKRFLMTCVVIFTISSLMCGFAPSLAILIMARIAQGAGGGGLQPIANAVMLESFPASKRGMAMAIYGLGVVVAPVIGPTLGGWITDNYSWRWVYYINIPIGMLGLWLMHRFLEDPPYIKNAKPGRVDGIGFGLMAIGLAVLQVVLDKGQEDDWLEAAWIRWAITIIVASLMAFVIWELRVKEPIVNLRVLGNRNFMISTILITVMGIVVYAPLTMLPQFLQGIMGYTAELSGLTQSPRGLGAVIAMPLVGILISRIDSRAMIAAGFILVGITCYWFGNLTLEIGQGSIILPNIVQGGAIGLIFVPLTTLALGMLRNEQIGNASSIFSLMRNLGGSIGISTATTLLARSAQAHQVTMAWRLTPYNPAFQQKINSLQQGISAGTGAAQAAQQAYGAMNGILIKQATLLAYVDNFRWLALGCLICVPLIFLLKKVKARGPVAAH
ncbi:MAG TPA: DHA2 family efflux MFS transporter permease subunit [Blastocatellia bacterium]|nr:DHA2 family efflux MFS transporter permease subunit [Blastocatellia bacterium]